MTAAAKTADAALSMPHMLGAVYGIHFPVIGSDASAHLQCLLYQLEHTQWLPKETIRER